MADPSNTGSIQDKLSSSAQSTANTVQNHPVTQNIKDSISNGVVSVLWRLPTSMENQANTKSTVHLSTKPNPSPTTLAYMAYHATGPVADKAREEKEKTAAEFRNVADARKTPSQPAATGQPLTHYHSVFYSILSWENPRVSAIAFASIVVFILACRYLPALRWGFRFLYVLLGLTAFLEAAGKFVFSQGVASTFRPKRYYTIPREALEASLEDVEQLINFFVIEFQRILFAENVTLTFAACGAAFISYWLTRIVPLWGLSLIGTTCIFLGPLIYLNNKELIDSQLTQAQDIVNAQATQAKDIASHHTSQYTETIKQYAGEYTAKAQGYIGSARRSEPAIPSAAEGEAAKAGPGAPPKYNANDFPHAPKQNPVTGVTSHQEQYEKSKFGGKGEAVPAS